jgi:hypothetical protein
MRSPEDSLTRKDRMAVGSKSGSILMETERIATGIVECRTGTPLRRGGLRAELDPLAPQPLELGFHAEGEEGGRSSRRKRT